MTLHEKIICETLSTMNAAFVQLNVPLIIRRIRRSDIIWQQRRARRNLLHLRKTCLTGNGYLSSIEKINLVNPV